MKSTQPFAVQLAHINSICQAALATLEPGESQAKGQWNPDDELESLDDVIPPRLEKKIVNPAGFVWVYGGR